VILQKLVDQQELEAKVLRQKLGDALPSEDHAEVAWALESYLRDSGEYRYSLELRRQDDTMDPVEDFVCNVKSGHCSRFASALTLMLRALGIPARIVLGFHGVDSQGDGNYLVRQLHAHSWVEALVRFQEPGGSWTWHWLRLDPTPAAREPLTYGQRSEWFASWSAWSGRQILWGDLLGESPVHSHPSFRQRFWDGLGLDQSSGPPRPPSTSTRDDTTVSGSYIAIIMSGVVGMLVGLWLVRHYWRRADSGGLSPDLPEGDFYQRLLAILSRRCQLERQPAQTPREFAVIAHSVLCGRLVLATLVNVPSKVVHLYYRIRFGRLPLTEVERRSIDAQVEQLDVALTLRPANGLAAVEKRS
jgi:hypothetical protein